MRRLPPSPSNQAAMIGATLAGIGTPLAMAVGLRRALSVPTGKNTLLLFGAGAATAFVALIAENLIWAFVGRSLPQTYGLLIRAFLMIALVEELAKLGMMVGHLRSNPGTDFRTLAAAAATIGAGFAGAENIVYVFRHGEGVLFMRLLTATPFHVAVAIVAARMLWLSIRENAEWYLPAALATSVLLHGLYDYAIFTSTVGDGKYWFALALTVSLAIGLLRRKDAALSGTETT